MHPNSSSPNGPTKSQTFSCSSHRATRMVFKTEDTISLSSDGDRRIVSRKLVPWPLFAILGVVQNGNAAVLAQL
eukprot:scaffold4917_cov172-Amphora_coffeaeformis.AAC.3